MDAEEYDFDRGCHSPQFQIRSFPAYSGPELLRGEIVPEPCESPPYRFWLRRIPRMNRNWKAAFAHPYARLHGRRQSEYGPAYSPLISQYTCAESHHMPQERINCYTV